MKPGPRPEPAALKLLKGNPGKRRIRPEPRPGPGAPACPRWLPRDAREEWRRIGPELTRLGLLTRLDRALFAAYCVAWSQFKAATEELAALEALHVRSEESGALRPHPLLGIRDSAGKSLLRLAGELGLSAAARVGLVTMPLPPPPPKGKAWNPARRFFS